LGLLEINPANRRFTWANNQQNLVLAMLDWIFVSTEWDQTFPLARVVGLAKGISDHSPLMIDFGDNCSRGEKKFRFKKWLLKRSDFGELVKKAWSSDCQELWPLDRWQNKVRIFSRLVRVWVANVVTEVNRTKQEIAVEYYDMEPEVRDLDEDKKNKMKALGGELENIWALEEIKVRQRSRDINILEGDRNAAYFHAIANQRHRKRKTECIRGPERLV
jgi:hypothetical protein